MSNSNVSEGVQAFINQSLADNNQLLLNQITKLVSDSVEKIKCSSSEAADEKLREIKKLRLEDHKSFNRKGNEIQYKFNCKVQGSLEEVQFHLETNAVDEAKEALARGTHLLDERQKLILLADKSEFGWKTVEEYTQHELAEDDLDAKKIRHAEERAEKALKSRAAKRKPFKTQSLVSRPSTFTGNSRFGPQNFVPSTSFTPWRNRSSMFQRPANFSLRPGNYFACGRFGYWRSECPQRSSTAKGSKSDDR